MIDATHSATPLAMTATRSRPFSVRLRLKMLLGALLLMLALAIVLLGLRTKVEAADHDVHQRVLVTLDSMRAAEQAKDALVALRRGLAVSATTENGEAALEQLIAEKMPAVLATTEAVAATDASASLATRKAALALSESARLGMRALLKGDRAAGVAQFAEFSKLGAPGEAALDRLLGQQQLVLRNTLNEAEISLNHSQWIAQALHLAIMLLGLMAVLMVFAALFQPLQKLNRALNRVAGGEALDAPPITGNDEFGQLGKALYEFSKITTQLNTVAYRDNLTLLPNRAQFERDLTAALQQKQPFALLFADIDHFRTINDGYGHHFGDAVLRAVGERLQWLIHGDVHLYRYSGDLFALAIHSGPAFAAESFRTLIADETERLRGRMAEHLPVDGRRLPLCLSFGVALFPDDGSNLESLVSAADAAMYQAKYLGRNTVQFARGDYALKARRRLELADDLRSALQTGAVAPHFQPIVDLGAGAVICAEALARWKHPTRGNVPPDEFIGIAEESGQIDVLTLQLLRSACATAVQWQAVDGRAPPRLAFNLSPRQVRQGVVEMVSSVLAETGLPAARLEIEITESAIIERPETAERLLRELKDLGVSVALDDFGTGYSSLSYLLRFPIDKIKVDRSFVAQLNGQRQAGKIVAATISLATNLEITLVAEGVENIGQMLTLYELGCRQQQGWLFSKALPPAEFSQWVRHAPLRLDAVVRAQAEAANEMQPAA